MATTGAPTGIHSFVHPQPPSPLPSQVGGRYSVCSAVGMLPLTLQYGWDVMSSFLAGANAMDDHFLVGGRTVPGLSLGLSADCQQTVCGLSADCLCTVSKLSVDCLRTVHGLCADRACLPTRPPSPPAHPPTSPNPPTHQTAPLESNLPVLMGLTSLWNISFLGYPARAVLPYCQVGSFEGGVGATRGRLPGHIQPRHALALPPGYPTALARPVPPSPKWPCPSRRPASSPDPTSPPQPPLSTKRPCPSWRPTSSRCPWSQTARAWTSTATPCRSRWGRGGWRGVLSEQTRARCPKAGPSASAPDGTWPENPPSPSFLPSRPARLTSASRAPTGSTPSTSSSTRWGERGRRLTGGGGV